MAKESPYGIDKRLIFRETFSSEAEVRKNGGIRGTTEGSFVNGTWVNTKNSYLNYTNITIPKGTYTFRFVVNNYTPSTYSYLFSSAIGSLRLADATYQIAGT